MPSRVEVLGDGSIRRQKTLRMPGRFEPLHVVLVLARRSIRMLAAVVERATLPVCHAGQYLTLRRAVAFEFVCDDHPSNVLTALEELAEELLGGLLVPSPLHQDVEHYAVLIHRPPQIVPLLVDRDEYFIQVPFVAWSGAPPS